MEDEQVQQALRDAEINYAPVWQVSNAVFTKKASEVLNIPVKLVEVRRNIVIGKNLSTLHVIVYNESDEEKAYYKLNNGAKHYDYLPTNINDFAGALLKLSVELKNNSK